MTNNHIAPDAASIALIEALRVLLFAANALPAHAPQRATFGDIATAIRSSLAYSIEDCTNLSFGDCASAAWAIYSAMIYCGEDTTYCIALLNDGVIDLDFRI